MNTAGQYKADFHTHSVASPDGSLTEDQYRQMVQSGGLDYVAVTDHDTIAAAVKLHAVLGDAIIVGEEISSAQGEIIGLFLQEVVPPGLSALDTIERIKGQGGLVYIPHPFETLRRGVQTVILDQVAEHVDIIEAYNGRAVFQNKTPQALAWASAHDLPVAASSDAHGLSGWGRTYSVLSEAPTAVNLPGLLREALFCTAKPGVRGMLYPKMNRLMKWRPHA